MEQARRGALKLEHFNRGIVQANVVIQKTQRRCASHASGATTDNGHCIVRLKDASLVQRSDQAECTNLLGIECDAPLERAQKI
ncbi:hypothetical protein C3Y91_24690 [Rhizobium sp. UPM1133]|nr:hypothetical protein [Rhizobium ruizarguesonis]